MGLAAPRKRMKLSHDPNNTTWTKDTTSFGHKIMRSQGWQPGEYLGAKDAPHAEFHTSANASGVKVVLKDDNLGLGAKKGSALEGESTGLDVFQRLLGRLNGKDEEELERVQRAKDDLRRALYTEQRWGATRFVRGGFLIGDKIQELIESEAQRIRSLAGNILHANGLDESADTDEKEKSVDKKSKVKKEKRKRKLEDAQADEPEISEGESSKKDKKKKKKSKGKEERSTSPPIPEKKDDLVEEIKPRKKKRKDKLSDEPPVADATEEQRARSSEAPILPGVRNERTDLQKTPDTAVPSVQSPSIQFNHTKGRHAVRSRHIAQKRMAVLDTASLNQIFMIKPPSA